MRILADEDLRRWRRRALWREVAWHFGSGFIISFVAIMFGWWLGKRSHG